MSACILLGLRTYKATISYLPVNEDIPSEQMTPLPPLDEPLPDQRWVTMTGEFVCVYSSIVPFIGTDLFFAPKSVLDDGIIWLMIVKGREKKLFCRTFENQHNLSIYIAPVSKFQVTNLLLR